MSSYQDLTVWQKSIEIVVKIYQLTQTFPKEETYGLCDQMRRAAVSIPSNIAEGQARNTQKDFSRFLNIAQGSRAELETQIIIAEQLHYLEQQQAKQLLEQISEINLMLRSLIRALKDLTD